MSWTKTETPVCADGGGAVDLIIEGRPRDLGGFSVRRVLPSPRRRTVGPFIFFDEMGPADFDAGQPGIDVRPHPHIGLATVTYLFEGEILHRDSLGSDLPIRPGAVNWMVAGRGIVHSERTAPEVQATRRRLHGIQSWVALPRDREETDPEFHHHAADTLPVIDGAEAGEGVRMRLIAGTAFGRRSPVITQSDLFYLDVEAEDGASVTQPDGDRERAVYVVSGAAEIGGLRVEAGTMAVLAPDRPARAVALGPSRMMLLGGAPLDGKRHIWWNFVSSTQARIDRGKRDWAEGRFPPVPGETEFIPLPDK
ncbi:MAG: pirin family protein [Inquilinaceae bacterium]